MSDDGPDSDRAVDIEAIVAELSEPYGLPRRALRAAAEHWDAISPTLLAMLQAYLRDPDAHRDNEGALFFAVHLFGQMRETRAYPLLMQLCSRAEAVDALLGDAVGETLDRVAASVFDGDPGPLKAVILDRDADEYARCSLLDALAFLTGEGRIDRADTKAFLRECFDVLRPSRDSFVWVGWQRAISYLGLAELEDLVRKAFRDRKIGPEIMDFADFQQDLRQTLATGPGSAFEHRGMGYFGDTIETLSSWHGFSDEYRREQEERLLRSETGSTEPPAWWPVLDQPELNPFRHVGRNDPCPCGSGKKFKKCCLGKL